MSLILTNTDTVYDSDAANLQLISPNAVKSAVVGGTTYLFVASGDPNGGGLSVFSVSASGTLTNVANVADDSTLNLKGVRDLATLQVGSVTYLLAAGSYDAGLSVFSVASNGALTNAFNLPNVTNLAIATATIGGTPYLFVGGYAELSVYSIAANGSLTSVAYVADNGTFNLDLPFALVTATVGVGTYLFAAGKNDNGVSVFSVAANGALTNVSNVSDGGQLELGGAAGLAVAVVGATTYLFVAGETDDGISVFSVASNGALTSVFNVADNGTLKLASVSRLTTAAIDGTTYLFASSWEESGFSVFSVGSNGALTNVANIADSADLALSSAFGIAAGSVGTGQFLFATGLQDHGVSAFRMVGNTPPTGSVTISGTTTQGQTLTASNTLSDSDGLGTITYQWQRGGVNVSGATGTTYVLTEADVGKTIDVVAKYVDADGIAEQVASAPTASVANVNDAPTGSVTISGTPTQNQTLTASNSLADADGLGTIAYQWQRAGANVSGATGTTYALTEADVGKTIGVVARYTDGHGTAEQKASAATPAVANVNDAPTGAVTIGGTATQGQTLIASNTLADADGLGTIEYQWQRAGVDIPGATGTTYALTQADVGKTIHVVARYTDGHGTAEQRASAATATVADLNDAPVLGAAATASYNENAAPIVLAPGLTLTDDGTTLARATVHIADGSFAGDVLAATTTGTSITAGYNAATQTLTLSGTDTLTHYQQVLRSVTYVTTSDNPTDHGLYPARSIEWQVFDSTTPDSMPLGTPTTLTTAAAPFQSVLVDLNGDGKPDLVYDNSAGADVYVAFGDGAGSFGATTTIPVANTTTGLITGDFDGDGDRDIVVVTGTTASLLRNDGHGAFTASQAATLGAAGPQVNSLVADDFDRDGKLDLVTVLGFHRGNGDGTFAAPTSAGSLFGQLVDGDFNGDGKLDLAASSNATVVVALGNGNGTFQTPASYAVLAGTQSNIALGDVDNDGDLDVVTSSNNGAGLNTLINNGSGVFTVIAGFGPIQTLNHPTLSDQDGDGTLDVVVRGVNNLRVLHGNGDGTFTLAQTVTGVGSGVWPSAADLNGDGAPDIAALDSSGSSSILLNTSTNRSAIETTQVTVTAVNDAPVLTQLDASRSATEQTAVMIDGDVTIADAELDAISGTGNHAGASLTIARSGGASAQDSFGLDTAGALFTVSGGNLQSGGQTFATFADSAGTLTVNFSGSGTAATTALVNDVLRHVTYINTSDAPPAGATLAWTFHDGNSGAQGSGGDKTASGSIQVNIAAVNDAPTGAVTISGTPTQGQTLTASNALADADGLGAISYQWQRGGIDVAGATGTTYALTEVDVGQVIDVVARYTDLGGTHEQVTSAATAAVANLNDAPTGAVTIGGTATQGGMLTASNTLSDADGLGSITYQWLRGGIEVSGATGATYVLAEADVGKTVSVVAQYTDGHGAAEAVASAPTVTVTNLNDAPTGAVTISGAATQGQMLTASNTLADADGLGAITYQWQRDGTDVPGATGATYALTETDVGKSVGVVARYTDGHGTAEQVSSLATVAITNLNDAPTGTVTISGAATQGQVLTASNTLADADGLGAITYQWQRDGTDVPGATGATYALTETDVGKSVSVVARYTDGHGTAEQVSSLATAAITNLNDAPTGTVTISGAATQGQVLSASNTLADADGLGAITYQWQRGGIDVSGATGPTYALTEADVGKTIDVVARFTDGHGTAEQQTSATTAVVANLNDAPTGAVTISGTPTQGETLIAANTLGDADGLGAITYQWQRGGVDVSGATGTTYALTEADVGKTIDVVARYTDGHGTAEQVSSLATAAVTNLNDAPTGIVTISGTATQGGTLTASNTLADADGLGAITYQWQRGGIDISGATGTTYVLTEADVGKTVTVVAKYTDGHGTAEAVASAATAAVTNINDAPTGVVTISGMPTQGETLTASNALADADGLGSITYQWQRGGVDVSGATGTTYVLTEADVGKTIDAVAKYVDGGGTAEQVASTPTAAVTNINDAPTGTVTISGTATQGGTLSASNTLADADGLGAITYQWQRGGIDVSGATGTTYVLSEADVGKTITAVAKYTDGHGTAEAVASTATAAVTNLNDAPTGSVTISGTATQGETLTASNTLADADGLGAINYQWQRGGFDVSGATGTTYALTEADVGKTIGVVAKYVDGGGTAEQVASAPTAAVANVNDAPAGTVTISGTPTQGGTLTASNTLADADGLGAITYQWQRNGVDVSGATGTTYVLTEADVGKTVTVVAKYTDGHGTAEAVASAATAAVTNLNDAPTGVVTISGTPTQGETLTASNALADADGLGSITYQWQRGGVDVSGATGTTYVLTEADVGKTIDVVAKYVDGGGTAEQVASTPTAAVTNINDALTGTVTISGTATQGGTLTASNTLADADGLGGITYQWQRNGVDVSGATGTSYLLGDADVGATITVRASYLDGHGSAESVASGPTAAVTNVNDAPSGTVTIAGNAVENQTLTASNTLADADGLGAITYQWQRGGSDISGATGSTYRLGDADVGAAIAVVAKYVDGHGTVESVVSALTATVTNVNDPPTGAVTISGIAAQGQTLTAANTLADADGLGAVTHQWQRDGIDMSGATGTAYLLTEADVGAFITVWASYTDGHGTAEAVTSQPTAAVTNVNDAPTGTVTISGIAVEGGTLTASNTLADADGLGTITYQWQRGGADIGGATGTTYLLVDADVGSAITVVAGYIDGHGTAEQMASAPTTGVINLNDAPVLEHPLAGQNFAVNHAFDFTVPGNSFSDPNGDLLTYAATLANGDPLPSWVHFDATLHFSGTPATNFVGDLDIKVVAGDGALTASDHFLLSFGNGGNDLFVSGTGTGSTDSDPGIFPLAGGAGNDTYLIEDDQAQVLENAGAGADTVYATVSYTMPQNVEGLVLQESGGAIDATGTDGADTIIGNGFANTLNGGAGSDALIGGGGDDVLIGGAGDDGMAGGTGNDTYNVDSTGDQVSENFGEGQDTVYASVSYGLTSNVEGLVLTEAGGAINATGNGSDNYIFGNSAANSIDGGAGNDVLFGGGGADLLVGGAGDDVLVGGEGDDLFAFAPGQFGHDKVTDFTSGDRIVFDHTLFADFADLQAHAVQSGAHTVIEHDPGNVLTLSNVEMANLTAHDFMFA